MKMEKTMLYQKRENLCKKFEKQIDSIIRDLKKKGYCPMIGNIFGNPGEVFTYQVFCYLGHGEGKKFEYSLLPDGKVRQNLNSKN